MKFLLLLFALALTAGASLAAEAPVGRMPAPLLLAQASAMDRAAAQAAPASDTFSIPAAGGGKNAMTRAVPEPENTMSLWQLVQSGGWAMIPLGFLSVVTVMFVLVFLFTLRRGSDPHAALHEYGRRAAEEARLPRAARHLLPAH